MQVTLPLLVAVRLGPAGMRQLRFVTNGRASTAAFAIGSLG
jgi:hypothetical protein